MQKNRLIYLASPYSKYGAGYTMAFVDVSRLVARIMRLYNSSKTFVYSPIIYTHPVAIYGNIDPLSHDFWLPIDEIMMNRADELWVAKMDGWQESYGIQKEIDTFTEAHKPVLYLDVDNLDLTYERQ